ncbi:adenosine deaminase [Subtercola endophyticus]|uniref:adenosine deaminase n=1 Tax=Subtercola endophyticus TaxID=2895559 RepID=UPI001E2EA161|nr:adenosine deaminase [Subtercola endophyticus]UFS58201.1 adenosine deaminase [Subtercola endophyticus]
MTHAMYELPKAELHLHIEGTLEPEMVFALAERNGIEVPFESVDDLRSRLEFTDLQSFLDVYFASSVVLREEQDFYDLAAAYLAKAHGQGLRHVEMFFDPQAHTARGVAIDTVIDGLKRALDDAATEFGITGGLILCFLRDLPVESAFATLEAVASRALAGDIIGVGLDSTEVGYPPELFEQVYARARDLGLHCVAHAGEEGGPEFVEGSLDALKCERIDHGIRSLQSPALVERLRREQVPLTVCPLSTVRLRGVDTMAEHPLPRMLEAGLLVTVNSDDPSYFGGYIGDNYRAVQDTFGFSDEAMAALAMNSVQASFAPAARKAELRTQIAEWVAGRAA